MKPLAHDTLLELEKVTFRYPGGGIGLSECSLTIRRGTRNALIGANGSGKTTLFQHANGLFRPQSGIVRYAGANIDYDRSGLRQLRSKVGMVFQNPDRQLFSASVMEDVSFGPFNLGLDEATVRQRVATALHAVGMADFAERPVHNLSFGQKKRVCIAGVLAMDPELLILDEPMAGLDQAMRAELLSVLDDLHRTGITLLVATHDIDFAYHWAERIHLMAAGRCTASLAATEVAEHRDALMAAGQTLPRLVELQRGLTRRGLLASSDQPRTVDQLLAMLEKSSLGSEVPACIA